MTTSEPLHVAFVWHMHQPEYRSARTGAFAMPWARMHALKDYLDMVGRLSDFPTLGQTFNLVPSLVEQLEVYASGTFRDVYWEHTLRPADDLDPQGQAFVLERMCETAHHPRSHLHPRLLELARKRDSLSSQGWVTAARGFSVQEFRDLQLWFNLAWCGNRALADTDLGSLVERGQGFTEEDKQVLAKSQASLLSSVLPAYREAASRGQVELTTSPYFHPILPLLCDTDSARIASSRVRLPPLRFAHPEDAFEQVSAGLEKHEQTFGHRPRGMWCSEMAVGEAIIAVLARAGIKWTISDEDVLARSLAGASAAPQGTRRSGYGEPYQPYRLVREDDQLDIVFRDHTLSDLIGFTYRSWAGRDAAQDLLSRLRAIRRESRSAAPLVVIALDGENAWEHYPENAREFFNHLYEDLSQAEDLECVTVSDHLAASPQPPPLGWLHTGSWISADLTTWIGSDAHNTAWQQLHLARDLVRARSQTRLAWQHVLAAEGSDWFWWFGEHHHTALDHVWDSEFRLRLREVYRLLGLSAPSILSAPLAASSPSLPPGVPSAPMEPAHRRSIDPPGRMGVRGAPVPHRHGGDAVLSGCVHYRGALRSAW